jgi:hypothetical protein
LAICLGRLFFFVFFYFFIDLFNFLAQSVFVMKNNIKQSDIKLRFNHYGASFVIQAEGTTDRVNRFINGLHNFGGLRMDGFGAEKVEKVEVGNNSFANFQISKENLFKALYNMKLTALVYVHKKGGRIAKKLATIWAHSKIAEMSYDNSLTA